MKTNIASASIEAVAPVSTFLYVTDASRPSPCARVTSALSTTSMFPVLAIWSTRYCDMPCSMDDPRTSMVTFSA